MSILDELGDLSSIFPARGNNMPPNHPNPNSLLAGVQPVHRLEILPSPVIRAQTRGSNTFTPGTSSQSSAKPPLTNLTNERSSTSRGTRRKQDKRMPLERKEAILTQLNPALLPQLRAGKIGQEEFKRLYDMWTGRKRLGWYSTDLDPVDDFVAVDLADFKAVVQRKTGLAPPRAATQQAESSAKKRRV